MRALRGWAALLCPAVAAAQSCPGVEQDTNYNGDDLKRDSASSADECCDMCNKESGCKYWTFHKGKSCYLKTDKGSASELKGDVSGSSGDAPAPPAPTPAPAPSPPTPAPPPVPPTPPGSFPSLPMQNAVAKGAKHFPLTGLGTKGPGYKLGQTEECWYYPQCCTKDHCPSINATRDYIKLVTSQGGVARVESGFPYGDNIGAPKSVCPNEKEELGAGSNATVGGGNHKGCDTWAHGKGFRESGAKRDQVFFTIKVGYAGPMGKQTGQIKSVLGHMELDYADLCLGHLPEIGPGTGSHGEYGPNHCVPGKKGETYDPVTCRVNTYASILDSMNAGKCKAVGVNNWSADEIEDIKKAGHPLPAVAQYKFHPYHSTSVAVVKELVQYCKENGIIFNAIAPLGVPDWVTFDGDGMAKTVLEEPKVKAIAQTVGKTPAQVILRWIAQQGIATQPRTMTEAHMKENIAVFDWTLSDDDMATLDGLPQCGTERGNPYMDGDPNGGSRHGNVVGVTEHC